MNWSDHRTDTDPLAPSRGCLVAAVLSCPFWAIVVAIAARILTR